MLDTTGNPQADAAQGSGTHQDSCSVSHLRILLTRVSVESFSSRERGRPTTDTLVTPSIFDSILRRQLSMPLTMATS